MEEAVAVSVNNVAISDLPAVDVAQAAELTGLSKDAIRGRIRRGAMASDVRDGRHMIPLAELRRQGLLAEGERYRAALERAESLEARLRAAQESCERAKRELGESQETVKVVWAMVQHKDQELERLREARERQARVRWPWRRSASPAPENG
jgi:hypothetical protein